MSKPDWATKEVEKYSVAGDTIRSSARFVFAKDAVKLLRQERAKLRLVLKRLKETYKNHGKGTYGFFYKQALDDVQEAMEEGT